MARNKLFKFEQIKQFSNVFEFPESMKGKWVSDVFDGNGDLVLELACGKGAYTLALADLFSERNFIGVDRKGERIWRGAKTAIDEEMKNVAFVRCFIEKLADYFGENEVDEIWITFPDPFPKKGFDKRRLTYKSFLDIYRLILKPDGVLHLKTDDHGLYEFSLGQFAESGLVVLDSCEDIYSRDENDPVLEIKTDYELRHLAKGKKITYIAAKFG